LSIKKNNRRKVKIGKERANPIKTIQERSLYRNNHFSFIKNETAKFTPNCRERRRKTGIMTDEITVFRFKRSFKF
jgi:hypothetical protein